MYYKVCSTHFNIQETLSHIIISSIDKLTETDHKHALHKDYSYNKAYLINKVLLRLIYKDRIYLISILNLTNESNEKLYKRRSNLNNLEQHNIRISKKKRKKSVVIK